MKLKLRASIQVNVSLSRLLLGLLSKASFVPELFSKLHRPVHDESDWGHVHLHEQGSNNGIANICEPATVEVWIDTPENANIGVNQHQKETGVEELGNEYGHCNEGHFLGFSREASELEDVDNDAFQGVVDYDSIDGDHKDREFGVFFLLDECFAEIVAYCMIVEICKFIHLATANAIELLLLTEALQTSEDWHR